MERSYSGHDGIVYFGLFDRWIMSVVGVKQLYNEIDGGLNRSAMYRFKDATVSFLESGDVKDGSPVQIRVEGDTSEIFDDICKAIGRNFPALRGS